MATCRGQTKDKAVVWVNIHCMFPEPSMKRRVYTNCCQPNVFLCMFPGISQESHCKRRNTNPWNGAAHRVRRICAFISLMWQLVLHSLLTCFIVFSKWASCLYFGASWYCCYPRFSSVHGIGTGDAFQPFYLIESTVLNISIQNH